MGFRVSGLGVGSSGLGILSALQPPEAMSAARACAHLRGNDRIESERELFPSGTGPNSKIP